MTAVAQDRRKRLIGAVHAAAARRGIDDDTRRALMARVTGKDSAARMSADELGRVLDAINGGARPSVGAAPREPGWRRKARALWISAHQLGLVDDGSDRALDAFVRRQTGVASVRWLAPEAAASVIEALKSWLAREGGVDWRWPRDADDRQRIAIALFRRLGDAGVTTGAPLACEDYCSAILGIHQRRPLTGEEWGRALPVLAARLRRASADQEG